MKYSKPISELITKRYSCRTYQQVSIDAKKRDLLSNFAAASITGPLGTPARFELVSASEHDNAALRGLGTYGFIKGATGFIIGAMEREKDRLEEFGYLLEGIILYATELGLGTCWLGGTFTKSSFARKIQARENELVPAVASVGNIAKKPRRIESLLRGRVGPERRFPWERLFFDGRFGVPLNPQTLDGYQQILEMVRWSPSASNRQPWRIIKQGNKWHFYLQRTPGYRESPLVKYTTVADLQRIDMGIAMNHFELMTRELGLQGGWVVEEPSLEIPDEYTEYTVSWIS
jgi:nitroreductase